MIHFLFLVDIVKFSLKYNNNENSQKASRCRRQKPHRERKSEEGTEQPPKSVTQGAAAVRAEHNMVGSSRQVMGTASTTLLRMFEDLMLPFLILQGLIQGPVF